MKNYEEVIKASRRFAKEKTGEKVDVKIAVLGSASIQYFVMILRYMLHCEGVEALIYEGEYNGINMDVFDSKSPLYVFKPNIVIILPHYLDIKKWPAPLTTENDVNTFDITTSAHFEITSEVAVIMLVTDPRCEFIPILSHYPIATATKPGKSDHIIKDLHLGLE